jgi:hypothetical protein
MREATTAALALGCFVGLAQGALVHLRAGMLSWPVSTTVCDITMSDTSPSKLHAHLALWLSDSLDRGQAVGEG